MEVLLRVFWELFEKQCKESIYVFASCNRVADRPTTVRVSYIDRLVKEDDGGICVPGVWVAVELKVLVDRRRTKLEEQSSER